MGSACLWVAGRAPRTDKLRASVLLWGGWFAVTAVVFSYGGIIHRYYAVALAPAIGALVGIGAATLWVRRDKLWSRLTPERRAALLPPRGAAVPVVGAGSRCRLRRR